MKIHTIEQTESGCGSITNISSEHYDRHIKFRKGAEYAVVLAAYYGDCYTTHSTIELALNQAKKDRDYYLIVIDSDGNEYDKYTGEYDKYINNNKYIDNN